MLMQSVASVDHRYRNVARKQIRSAAAGVAHDDGVGTQRGDGPSGVNERLALFDAGGGRSDERGGGSESFGGELEGRPGASGRLVEKRSEEHTSELQSLRHLVCR